MSKSINQFDPHAMRNAKKQPLPKNKTTASDEPATPKPAEAYKNLIDGV